MKTDTKQRTWLERAKDAAKAFAQGSSSWAYDYIIFAVFCRVLTWFLQRICGAPEDVWQQLWNRFLDLVGHDEFTLVVIVTNVYTITLYWVVGSIFMFMDLTGWPKWVRKYKVQPGTHEPIDRKRLFAAFGQILFNQFCVGFPLALFTFPALKYLGIRPFQELPSFGEVMRDLVVFVLVIEVAAYYTHRMFHHRLFYKRFHKKHHEWTAPVALIATYCHPFEHLVSNLIPPSLGIVLMQSHMATAWLWYTFMIVITLSDHSGYHLPFFPSPEAHDYHHLKFNQYFGTLGIMDYLHGTNDQYRSTPQYKRHKVSPSLVPLTQRYPSQQIKKNH